MKKSAWFALVLLAGSQFAQSSQAFSLERETPAVGSWAVRNIPTGIEAFVGNGSAYFGFSCRDRDFQFWAEYNDATVPLDRAEVRTMALLYPASSDIRELEIASFDHLKEGYRRLVSHAGAPVGSVLDWVGFILVEDSFGVSPARIDGGIRLIQEEIFSSSGASEAIAAVQQACNVEARPPLSKDKWTAYTDAGDPVAGVLSDNAELRFMCVSGEMRFELRTSAKLPEIFAGLEEIDLSIGTGGTRRIFLPDQPIDQSYRFSGSAALHWAQSASRAAHKIGFGLAKDASAASFDQFVLTDFTALGSTAALKPVIAACS